MALGGASVVVAAGELAVHRGALPPRIGNGHGRPRLVLATTLSTAIAVAALAVGIGDYSLRRLAAVGRGSGRAGGLDSGLSGAWRRQRCPCPGVRSARAVGVRIARGHGPPSIRGSPAAHRAIPAHRRPSSRRSPAWPTPTPTLAPTPVPTPMADSAEPSADPGHGAPRTRNGSSRDGCFMSLRGSRPPDCVYGDPEGHLHGRARRRLPRGALVPGGRGDRECPRLAAAGLRQGVVRLRRPADLFAAAQAPIHRMRSLAAATSWTD